MSSRNINIAEGSDLWSFALSFSARPGVAALSLRLQAEAGIDVMLLIAHCYFSVRQKAPLSGAEVQAISAHVADWRRRAVLPLRTLRMDLREGIAHLPDAKRDAFRNQLKQVELAAEKVQADMISNWLAMRQPAEIGDFAETLGAFIIASAVSDAELALLIAAAHLATPSSV